MTDEHAVERLLADALRPIEPPERLSGRLEETLSAVADAAASELSDWAEVLSDSEREALRDPRNWVPAVAVTAGGIATGALVLLEMRRRSRQRSGGLRGLTEGLRTRL